MRLSRMQMGELEEEFVGNVCCLLVEFAACCARGLMM